MAAPASNDLSLRWPARLLILLLVSDLADQDLFLPDVALQTVAQQPLFQQAAIKLELQLFNPQRRQLRRQQA